MEKKNITDFSVVELKSLAYDQLSIIESAQSNLRILNQEIAARLNPPQPEPAAASQDPTSQVSV